MPSIRTKVRRTDVAALAVLVALSAAACAGSGAASASGNLVARSSSPTAIATASATQVATATPRRSPSAAATPSPGVPTVEIEDPDLTMTLPVGWASYPIETYRFIIESVVKSAGPEEQAAIAAHLKDIDAGAVRIASGGQISGANGTLIIEVDSGDPSLAAAVARLGAFGKAFTDSSSVDERPMTLAVGKAVRRVEVHPVPSGSTMAGVPSRTVEYIVRLDDGRTVWILATGPAVATTFEALIDASVQTLRSR